MPIPVVYIDVVWLVNLVMDGVILATTCWLLRRPVRAGRVMSGALIGSGYALLLFAPSLAVLTTWAGKAVASLLIVWVSIGRRSWIDLAKSSVMFYFVSFVFAGAAIAMRFAIPGVSMSKTLQVSGNRVAFTQSFSSLGLLVAIPLCIALIKYTMRKLRQIHLRAGMSYRVRVAFPGGTVTFTGLVDTGNQLRDPVSRQPVSFVDHQALQPVLPVPLNQVSLESQQLVNLLSEVEDERYAGRFTLVPFRGAGGQMQLTVALRPDYVELEQANKTWARAQMCLFAIHPGRLAHDGQFEAILHMEVTPMEATSVEVTANEVTAKGVTPTLVITAQGDGRFEITQS